MAVPGPINVDRGRIAAGTSFSVVAAQCLQALLAAATRAVMQLREAPKRKALFSLASDGFTS